MLATPAIASIPIKGYQTKSGLTVMHVADTSTPWIAVSFAFKNAGQKSDPKDKPGLGSTLLQLLFNDQEFGMSRPDERRHLMSLGVLSGFHYDIDQDNIQFSFKCPQESLPEVMALIAPYFSEPNFMGLKREQGASYKSYLARQSLMAHIFPTHPYGETELKGSLHTMTMVDVKQSHRQRFAKENLIISVVGGDDIKSLLALFESTFANLPDRHQLPQIVEARPSIQAGLQVIEKKTAQTAVGFVHPSVARQHEDYYKIKIINDILGGQVFTSRLWKDVREQHGWVYHIQTHLLNFDHASLLYGEFETKNEWVPEVVHAIRQQWQLLNEQGVSLAEFELAKSSLMGRLALNLTTPESIAGVVLHQALQGFPIDYINQRNEDIQKITYEEIQLAVKKYFDPNQLLFVAVGDPNLSSKPLS